MFDTAYTNVEIERQEKANVKKAKAAYVADLVKQGVDKEMAKTMANAFFVAGLITAM